MQVLHARKISIGAQDCIRWLRGGAAVLLVSSLTSESLVGLVGAQLGAVAGEVGGDEVVLDRAVLVEGGEDIDRVVGSGMRRREVGVGGGALGAGADEDGLDGVV